MKELMPFTNLPTLRQEFDRFLTRFDEDMKSPSTLSEWMPTMDVTESNGDFLVKAECPGLEVKDIHVRMDDGILTIEGEKKLEREEKSDRSYRRERTFGSFSRAIRFPKATDGTKIKAKLANGVLTLTVPKSHEVTGLKDIPIQLG